MELQYTPLAKMVGMESSEKIKKIFAMIADLVEVTMPDMCVGCGLCQVVCPDDAIGLREVRPLDYIPDSWRH